MNQRHLNTSVQTEKKKEKSENYTFNTNLSTFGILNHVLTSKKNQGTKVKTVCLVHVKDKILKKADN